MQQETVQSITECARLDGRSKPAGGVYCRVENAKSAYRRAILYMMITAGGIYRNQGSRQAQAFV